MSEKKTHRITIEMDSDTYKRLVEKAMSEGYSLIADYIVHILKSSLTQPPQPHVSVDDFFNKIRPKIERMIQDQTNRFMEMISDVRNRVAELYEKYDQLSETLVALGERRTQTQPRGETRRKTGIERLKEEKVLFESSLPAKINRDKFFAYLEREGAVVLKLTRERVAVDKEFWSYFKSKVFEEASTDEDEELKKLLGDKGYELFKKMRDDLVIFFDKKRMKWITVDRNIPLS